MYYGSFRGDVVAVWLDDGRAMKLVAPFEFQAPDGSVWVAQIGDIIDGASIPRFFWRIIGGPLWGKYRRASVIHDVYCALKLESWQDVHKMFWLAMRAEGCAAWRAKLMFLAVWYFGPRWNRLGCM